MLVPELKLTLVPSAPVDAFSVWIDVALAAAFVAEVDALDSDVAALLAEVDASLALVVAVVALAADEVAEVAL